MKEIFVNIPGYEGEYQISNLGRVKSLKSNIYLKPWKNDRGYYRIRLSKSNLIKAWLIHRLIWVSFVGPINGTIRFKDGNKEHYLLSNLEECKSNDEALEKTMLEKYGNNAVLVYENGVFHALYSNIVEAHKGTKVRYVDIIDNMYGKIEDVNGKVFRKSSLENIDFIG